LRRTCVTIGFLSFRKKPTRVDANASSGVRNGDVYTGRLCRQEPREILGNDAARTENVPIGLTGTRFSRDRVVEISILQSAMGRGLSDNERLTCVPRS
jgi:hypothetical protein